MAQDVPPQNKSGECRLDPAEESGMESGGNRTMNVTDNQKYLGSRLSGMSFLLGALFCAFLTITDQAFSEIPRGVFCLLGAGEGTGQHSFVSSNLTPSACLV